ncbi:hypothetical protein I4U23_012654 [Adineta vaga]|nr:hypothetical protein I4U23_012654 [Adineta vaga]
MVGTRVQNIDSFQSIYICPKCSLLLRDPIQLTDCGHRLCQSCADEQSDDIITCVECHQRISRKELKRDRGFQNDMKTLQISCAYCDWNNQLKNYQKHLNETHSNPICVYCNEKFLFIDDLNRHQLYHCEKITIHCPLNHFGCTDLIFRTKLNEHYRTKNHQLVLMSIIRPLQSIYQSMTENKLPMDTDQLEEIVSTIDVLSTSVDILNGDLKRLTNESTRHKTNLDGISQECSVLKTSIQEQNGVLNSIAVSQEALQTEIESLEGKISALESTTYDGTFTWKINDIHTKIADARTEKQVSIYSTPFYTSATGYKMCLRIYLNGDGNARGTYVSLFFVVMRGEYDAILKYPFQYKVIFCLYNQIAQKNHIIDSFRPDLHSNSFQRPQTDMNVASGIPKFALLSLLQQDNSPYVRDDTVYIKVMIDFNDMSTSLMEYALNLNPALTISVQQAMIQQEAEKHRRHQSSK